MIHLLDKELRESTLWDKENKTTFLERKNLLIHSRQLSREYSRQRRKQANKPKAKKNTHTISILFIYCTYILSLDGLDVQPLVVISRLFH